MIIPFPQNSPLLKSAFEVFQGSRESLLIFTPLVIVSRALLNMVTMQGHAQHTKILTDTILFFIGIYCLESLMMMIMSIPAYASELVANKDPVQLNKVPSDFHWFNLTLKIADLVDYLTTFIFHILSIVYLLIMSVAIMLGGYVVFFATLFQVKKVFSIFIMICVFLSAWPFIWYSLDRTFQHILSVQNDNASAMGTVVSLLVLSVMKLVIPIFGFLGCLQTPVGLVTAATLATKSGASAISGAAKFTAKTAWAPARAIGTNEVFSMATKPIATRVSNRMKAAVDSARDIAPFAAYKTSRLLKTSQSIESFSEFKTRNGISSISSSRIKSHAAVSSVTNSKQKHVVRAHVGGTSHALQSTERSELKNNRIVESKELRVRANALFEERSSFKHENQWKNFQSYDPENGET